MQVSIPPPWTAFVWDMNADGRFSLSDLGPALVHLFFLPGDSILWLVFNYAPSAARFLELSYAAFGGVESAVLSTIGWLLVVLALGMLHSMLLRLSWTIGAYVTGGYQEVRRRIRVARLLLGYRVQGWTRHRREPHLAEHSAEVDLDELDLEVLGLHRDPGPGTTLGIREIASGAGVSIRQARGSVNKLKALGLLADHREKKSSYQLTRPGEMFLTSRNLLVT